MGHLYLGMRDTRGEVLFFDHDEFWSKKRVAEFAPLSTLLAASLAHLLGVG
jgi:hypothetical protein